MSIARIIGLATVVAILLLGVIAVAGVGQITYSRGGTYAPCEEISSLREVEDAMAANADLIERIRDAGTGVQLDVLTPCEDDPDRALIRITHRSDDERERAQEIIPDDNFGVWLQIEQEPGWLDRLLYPDDGRPGETSPHGKRKRPDGRTVRALMLGRMSLPVRLPCGASGGTRRSSRSWRGG